MTRTLPSFPVDEGTLNVILDSLDRGYIGNDANHEPIRAVGTFRLDDVLRLLSGYQPSADPDVAELLFCRDDIIAALIHEIRSLRAHNTEETSQ